MPERGAIMPVPVSLADANLYMQHVHRHNGALPAAKMAVAAIDGAGNVVGVAVAGIPKARMLNDGYTLEVSRVCTEGTENACSFLYSCCLKAAKALGYWRAITYTLESEGGASLKASGWTVVEAVSAGGSWGRAARPPVADAHDLGAKIRWEVIFRGRPPELSWPDVVDDHRPASLFGADLASTTETAA